MFYFCSTKSRYLPWLSKRSATHTIWAGALWRAASVGAKTAQARNQAASAPIDLSWIWKRSYARAVGRFRCRVSKAACVALVAVTGAWL